MKFAKILLPFDGSRYSVHAANYAIELAKKFGSHITVVNCYEWRGNMPEVPEMLIRDLKDNLKKEAEETVGKVKEIFAGQGVDFTLETVSGPPGYVLARMAKSKEYDLIVMGSHGHSDIAGLFLGSVTHKVLNTIYCPVLVVP